VRREFSAKVRVAAYERSRSLCEGCGAPLQVGRFHYDHVLPDALGGDPTLENCAVLCRPCHDEKTHTGDVPQIAKMKRQRANHLGIRKPRSILGWKRFDGSIVRAPRDRT
jgi:5-methylcytosine-specific restriction protein A